MSDTILFYTSTNPGAQPFVRVPATPEGLRYAGYLARYNAGPGVHRFYECVKSAERDIGEGSYHVQSGWFGYPRNPGIPVGTERHVGDAVWCRAEGNDVVWTPVPEGAPPPRAA